MITPNTMAPSIHAHVGKLCVVMKEPCADGAAAAVVVPCAPTRRRSVNEPIPYSSALTTASFRPCVATCCNTVGMDPLPPLASTGPEFVVIGFADELSTAPVDPVAPVSVDILVLPVTFPAFAVSAAISS